MRTTSLLFLVAATSLLAMGRVAPTPVVEIVTISLESLVKVSDVIGIGVVVSQESDTATIEFVRTLKAANGQEVRITIDTSSTHTCDTSTAIHGELGLFFLSKPPDSSAYRLAHYGRGRMPTLVGEGRVFVYHDDIHMPSILSVGAKPEPPVSYASVSPLNDLIAQVHLVLARRGEALPNTPLQADRASRER